MTGKLKYVAFEQNPTFGVCTELPVASDVYSVASYEDISELRHTEDTQLQLHICSHCSFSRISVICSFPSSINFYTKVCFTMSNCNSVVLLLCST